MRGRIHSGRDHASRPPGVAAWKALGKSEPCTGGRAGPSRSDRPMRGNHPGSLSYLIRPLDHIALHLGHGARDGVEELRLRLAQSELELAEQRVERLHRLDRVADVDVGWERDLVERLS